MGTQMLTTSWGLLAQGPRAVRGDVGPGGQDSDRGWASVNGRLSEDVLVGG